MTCSQCCDRGTCSCPQSVELPEGDKHLHLYFKEQQLVAARRDIFASVVDSTITSEKHYKTEESSLVTLDESWGSCSGLHYY